MRVIWKDCNVPKEYKPLKYRKFYLFGTPEGWETSVPGDTNLYANHYCAQNAVDAFYGDLGKHGSEKRKQYGIRIVGRRTG